MTIGELLSEWSIEGARRLDAELLVAYGLRRSREWVFAHPEFKIGPLDIETLWALWERYQAGEPVAYLMGEKEFFGLPLKVDSRVLIPRPETEHLVEAVIDRVQAMDLPRIVDVGTGSGAIALALKQALPQGMVRGTDVSPEAVEVARENAHRLGLEVEFLVSDLLADVPWQEWDLDVMVANLPYIGTERFNFVEQSVKAFEPHVALFGGEDGLRLYDLFFEQLAIAERKPRWVMGEFGSLQREALQEMMEFYFPKAEVTFYKDLAGLDRFFVLELSHA